MNFKESYKKANDEIKGDRELLDKILNTPVKEKTKITPFAYKFASCAAAIILVGAIILMPEIKEKFVTEEEAAYVTESSAPEYDVLADTSEEAMPMMASEEAIIEETKDGYMDAETETVKTTSATTNAENEKATVDTAYKRAESTPDNGENVIMGAHYSEPETTVEEEAATEDLLRTDDVAEESDDAKEASEEPTFTADEVVSTSEATIAETEHASEVATVPSESGEKVKIASGGGSSSAARNMTGAEEAEKEKRDVTISEAIALIGINEASLTPSGMALTSSEVTYAEFSPEGNITAYEINMVFEKDGAKVIIRITDSATPLAFDVAGHSGMISASKTVGGTDVFVTAYNLTSEEVTNYLSGIN
ncbi:MAG: hypothetical protein Q4G23_11565 [Clostridia bacterium]|nr:hypothetical protein [Clostridia bacterium]